MFTHMLNMEMSIGGCVDGNMWRSLEKELVPWFSKVAWISPFLQILWEIIITNKYYIEYISTWYNIIYIGQTVRYKIMKLSLIIDIIKHTVINQLAIDLDWD